jgi:hypothetical protein
MSYEQLLDDLEMLQKSYAAADEGDAKIQAAAEGDDDDEELDEDGKPVAKKPVEKDDEKEGNPFAKSFNGTTADGEEFEAVDGTELIKSLNDRIDTFVSGAEVEKADLSKSLDALVGVIKSQGEMVKSLQAQVEKLSNEGRGRKSITQPSADMTKSLGASEPLNAGSFMLKANAAYDAGRLSGKELTVCDVAIRMGSDIDPSIITKIMG